MARSVVFAGPDGDYTVMLPEADPYEDAELAVATHQGVQAWRVETDEIDELGTPVLSGMTAGADGLWFVLRLGNPATVEFWGDRVLLRTDRAI
jgi:hypothetical protein